MKYSRTYYLLFTCGLLAAPAAAQNQIGGGTCSAATLNGTYSLTLSGRGISSSGNLAGTFQAEGTATFDGKSAVTFTGIVNTAQVSGSPFSYAGSYAIPSNCYGTITLITGSAAAFTLVVWDGGIDFGIVGSDSTYVYSGSGSNVWPVGCATATLSGTYSFSASGTTLSGTTQTGTMDEAGILQFDGQGTVKASYVDSSGGAAPVSLAATGIYSVSPSASSAACTATATLTDSNNNANSLSFVITGNYGAGTDLTLSDSQFIRDGSAHAAFLNPTQSIGNVASYAVNYTPPGSVFVLFGTDLASKAAQPITVPLPTELLTTQVLVNGTAVPLFYVSGTQIDAQMPWSVPGGTVASVLVKNGTEVSNAAAVYVPAAGTPGISTYNGDRAVVTNSDNSVNSGSNPAKVGDEVVAYFTGGGPVNAAATLVTGSPAPDALAWLTGDYSVTVGTATATVDYIGLTPEGIGLYQVNFVVPQLAKGTYAVEISIAGQVSNKPVMSVGN